MSKRTIIYLEGRKEELVCEIQKKGRTSYGINILLRRLDEVNALLDIIARLQDGEGCEDE